ncbi:zinc finger protein 2-like [Ostrinia furnacalis]|uniref:zinc finger protein 2-like n=1 Tax=Ostrinia furnacalis TaxID=93504 RepID=UPI00103F0E0D|nr:zinc finger protein 2-like [Ostrinia furnacalis]
MKACRFCLQSDGILCELQNSDAQNFIEEIFKQNGYHGFISSNYVCCMCKFLLNKSYKFVKKALRAQQILKDILENNNDITNASLKKIDRHKLELDENLVSQENSVNYCFWEENDGKAKTNFSVEAMENVCITKKEDVYGSETFLTPIDYYPEAVYGSENEQVHDFGLIKQENVHKIEIKIDVQNIQSENLDNDDDTKVKIDTDDYDEKPSFNNSDDDSDDKAILRDVLTRKCKKEVPATKNKKRKPAKPKQKRIKKEKRDYRKYPMKCDDCDHMVQSKMEHFHHYLAFHKDRQYPYRREGNYMCQHCGIVKTTYSHLSQHELTHGEKNVECKECGKKFHNLVRLQRHARRHEAVPRFRCHFCGKGFYAREDIQLHIRTHTGEKPFQCWLCPARFAHRGNVSVHVRNVHQRDAVRAPDASASHTLTVDRRLVTPASVSPTDSL